MRPLFAPAASPPTLITLVLLTALAVLSLNMFLPSLAHIASDFGISYATAALSIALYLALTAVLQLIMGPLSDMYGRRPIMLAGLGIFVVASIGCAIATDYTMFLIFRMAQGAVSSCMVLTRAVVRDMLPPQEAAGRLGVIASAMAIAPMLGPLAGGLLDEAFGWRSNFYAFALFGAALFVLCWADLGETNTTRAATFSAQFKTYPELFKSRRFWGYTFVVTFSVGTFHTILAGSPLVGATQLGLSPAEIGFYMGATSAGFFVGTLISSRIAVRVSLVTMTIAGRLLATVGLLIGLGLILSGHITPVIVLGFGVFVGLGNGITLPSANAGIMSVRPALAGSASGLSGAMTVAGGAVFTLITGALVTPDHGAAMLYVLLILTVLAGMLAAYYVRLIDQREGPLTE